MTVLDYRSAPPTDSDAEKTTGHWLAWAVYLAMSWTWCIGMFLPVLLVRDYGIWGWIVFAIPNVLGAAAMGWVIRDRATGARLVAAHGGAMMLFSGVTVAFQFFFAAWMFYHPPFTWMLATTVILAAVALVPAASHEQRRRFELFLTAAALAISIGCAALILSSLGFRTTFAPIPSDPADLSALTPVMTFGFLLCPYLDLTFHRARGEMNATEARLGFAIGFGTIFLAVIAFTLVYRSHLPNSWLYVSMSKASRWALPLYLMIQLAVTAGLHLRDVGERARGGVWVGLALLVFGSSVGLVSFWASDLVWIQLGHIRRPPAETMYRLFMGFYGLLFPAYVWLCMIPSPRATPTRGMLLVFGIAVLLAAPMFWMGFIQGKMIWLLPGLAVVLLSRLAIRRNPAG